MAKRLTAREITERNLKIIGMLLTDMPQAQVAREVGISERQVRRVWVEYSAEDKLNPRDEDPAKYVTQTIARLRALRSVLGSKLYQADNTAALVGCVRAISDLIDRETQLRQAVGYLPRNLGDLRVHFDVEFVSKVMFEVLAENEVPMEVYEELAEKLSAETGMTLSPN